MHDLHSLFHRPEGPQPVGEVGEAIFVQSAGENGGRSQANQSACQRMQPQLEGTQQHQTGRKAYSSADQGKERRRPPQTIGRQLPRLGR